MVSPRQFTAHDHQSILAQPDRNIHLFNYGGSGAQMIGPGTKTLPRELNLIYRQERGMPQREDLSFTNNRKRNNNKGRDFNFEFTSLHRNAATNNFPRRVGGQQSQQNKYSVQENNNQAIAGMVPNPDHIYESIDSESNFYDYNRRMNMLNYYGGVTPSGGGSSNYRSKSTINEDDLSSSSIYEDKPLLFSNNSFLNANNRRAGIAQMQPQQRQHYQSNASIYDRNQRQQQIINAPTNNVWQMQKDSSNELPDLVQKSNLTNNVIVSYSGDNKKFFNKVVNPANK